MTAKWNFGCFPLVPIRGRFVLMLGTKWQSRTFHPRECFLAPSTKEIGMSKAKSGSCCSFWSLVNVWGNGFTIRESLKTADKWGWRKKLHLTLKPALSVMDSPTFPEGDRNSELYEELWFGRLRQHCHCKQWTMQGTCSFVCVTFVQGKDVPVTWWSLLLLQATQSFTNCKDFPSTGHLTAVYSWRTYIWHQMSGGGRSHALVDDYERRHYAHFGRRRP